MKNILTLTVNPAIDKSATVNGIKPNSKLRCSEPIFEPGGGGINVSKVLKELDTNSECIYLAGGHTGIFLTSLLTKNGIYQNCIPIKGYTRENLAVTDIVTNQQFRFGMPGPQISNEECLGVLKVLNESLNEGDFLVASGSLSPGMPTDFYAQVSRIAKHKNAKFILDTSGEALILGAQEGAYLLKPNLGELSRLCGVESITFAELEVIAKEFLRTNPCEALVVSMGAQGALLITESIMEHINAPTVHQNSTVGAGDSMVAGMVHSLAQGKSFSEMARFGVACGTAATMTPGSELCHKKDIYELYDWINNQSNSNL